MSASPRGHRLAGGCMLDPAILELVNYGVAFGDRGVLRSVSFSMPVRGCTVLLGPSGTGKSTLLRTLAACNHANPALRTWGTAHFKARPCTADHSPALMMQHARLLVSNVFENLVCELPGRSSLTRPMQVEMVAEMLTRYGQNRLLDALSQKVIERSPGEQRVVSLLRMMMANPSLLMVDEPTTELDADAAESMLGLLEQLSTERAVLVVLHHLQQARRLAGQVVLLANGVVEEAAPGEAFFSAPRSECAKAFLRTGSCPELNGAALTAQAELAPVEPAFTELPPVLHPRSAAYGPRGFLWLLPGHLAGTPWPGVVQDVRYDLEALRSVGVTRLITLTETPFDAALAGGYGIACTFSPMPDMAPPTLAQGLDLCRQIDACITRGEVVAVHCRAGLGRTGTVLAAYWLWRAAGRIDAPKALEDVRRIHAGWVQSSTQVEFLEKFALVVANADSEPDSVDDPSPARDVAGLAINC
jgi:atypical dual specificity phosphatase